jgi:hypothetical protein
MCKNTLGVKSEGEEGVRRRKGVHLKHNSIIQNSPNPDIGTVGEEESTREKWK